MNMVFHDPNGFISIGIGHAAGFIAVPEERFIRNMLALFISVLISIPMGLIQATHRNTWIDYSFTTFSFIGYSVPTFFIGEYPLVGAQSEEVMRQVLRRVSQRLGPAQ